MKCERHDHRLLQQRIAMNNRSLYHFPYKYQACPFLFVYLFTPIVAPLRFLPAATTPTTPIQLFCTPFRWG